MRAECVLEQVVRDRQGVTHIAHMHSGIMATTRCLRTVVVHGVADNDEEVTCEECSQTPKYMPPSTS